MQDIKLVRKFTMGFLPKLLEEHALTRREIDEKIRANCPYRIDWDQGCLCGDKDGSYPEWKHQIGLAIWTLRRQGRIYHVCYGVWGLPRGSAPSSATFCA